MIGAQHVAAELEEGKLATTPITEEELFLDVSIAYFKNQQLSRPAQAFLDTLGQLASGERPIKGMGALISKGPSL